MPKPPKDLPIKGDLVKLKGRSQDVGMIGYIAENNWAWIDWHNKATRNPKICHLFELEKYAVE